MNKLLLAVSLLVVSIAASAQKVINDPNAQARAVNPFHAIHVSSSFDVILTQGNEEKVVVSASEEKYLQNITTRVENGVLEIKYEDNRKLWRGNPKLKAYIAVKNIDELKASGACIVNIEGSLNTSDFNLHLTGASKLKGQLMVNGKFTVDLTGASDVVVSGTANETNIEATGASDIKAYDFKTQVCTIRASGASDIKISVDKELSASLTGASTVNYKGSAMIRDIKTSGASTISRKS